MASRSRSSRVTVLVTPRFEIFYALQILESGSGEKLRPWRREMARRLSSRARTTLAHVAPSALMWPLLADALCDVPGPLTFQQMMLNLRELAPESFQRAVLGGVFKQSAALDGLIAGKLSLRRAVAGEDESRKKVLTLLGLQPFDADSAAAQAFNRLVSDPAGYRDNVVSALDVFWSGGFDETWELAKSQMEESAKRIDRQLERGGFDSVVEQWKLPHLVPKSVHRVNLIPSAFNVSRLWASYGETPLDRTVFIPVFDAGISLGEFASEPEATIPVTHSSKVDPSTVFKALGDTTRYAIATTLARNPMTSVELARLFKVSKPTISHHVQHLRAANLLIENPGDNGTVLSLDRVTLEKASIAAAAEMFSNDGPDHVVRRTRKTN